MPFQHCGYLEATRSSHKRETRWTREQKVRNDTTRNSFHNIVFCTSTFTCILRSRALLNCFNFPFLFNCLSFYVLYHAIPLSYIFVLVLLMDIYGNNIIKSKQRFSKLWKPITGMLASMLHRIGFISRPSFEHDILLQHVIVKGY